jgi:hypothetical protein
MRMLLRLRKQLYETRIEMMQDAGCDERRRESKKWQRTHKKCDSQEKDDADG